MKKIAIFGSYNGGSIGDTAILIGILSSLVRVYGNHSEFVVFTTNFTNIVHEASLFDITNRITEIVILKNNNINNNKISFLNKNVNRLYEKLFNTVLIEENKIIQALEGVEYLYIGGGNLIMDWFPNWPLILEKVCYLTIKKGVKYSFVGVGAGPFCTEKGKKILTKCINSAEFIYFRDENSKKLTEKKLNITNSKLGVDLAFGIEFNEKVIIKGNNKKLLVNIASVFGSKWPEKNHCKMDKYIEEYIKTVEKIIEKNKLNEIVILNTNPNVDQEGIDLFVNGYLEKKQQIKINIFENVKTVYELMCMCHQSDFAIVTRLHAGIIARIAGCSIKAVAYQPKVSDVLLGENLCEEDSIITLDDLIENRKELNASFRNNTVKNVLKNQVDEIFMKLGRN